MKNKPLSVAMRAALDDALVNVCQFIETLKADYSQAVEDALIDIDLSDEAFDEAYAALCDVIDYTPGERPDDDE